MCPSMKDKLQECVCDVCHQAFPSKAQMLVHRRDLHKFQRKVELDIDELIKVLFLSKVVGPSFEYELENDTRLEELQQILDHNKNTKEYLCSFKGDVEVGWITILDDNHPLVVKYFKQINQPLPLHSVQNPTWMKPVWHTD